MSSPLQRLYRTRLVLIAVLASLAGIVVVLLGHWLQAHHVGNWLSDDLVPNAGLALFTTGLIAIFFEYVNNVDAEERGTERLRSVVEESAPVIRDSVVEGFAFAPDSLTAVSSPETLDRIVENTLAIRLGDKELAADASRDLRQQIIGARQRWYDARASVALAPWTEGPDTGREAMFVATIRWEYSFTPSNPVFRFSCVSDLESYRDLLSDPTSAAEWYFPTVGKLNAASPEVFELVELTVDGKPQKVRRGVRKEGQSYTVNLGDVVVERSQRVRIAYTYRVLMQRHGHLLHLDLAQPTKDFSAEISYGDCGIWRMNVVDYLSGPRQPRVAELAASDPSPSVQISYPGWTFPKGGVVCSWVLEDELAPADRPKKSGLQKP
ncbi:hypothetical protein [Streptomyces sp. NPDC050548]|uniref:hypothetical protein n=1 Tax=Streptomyces sp. NPDC050548 TaxID=3365629 RepID=UPI00379BD16D